MIYMGLSQYLALCLLPFLPPQTSLLSILFFWLSSTRYLGACEAPHHILCISTLCETVRLVPCTVTITWDTVSILSSGGAHPTNALSSIYFSHGTSWCWLAPLWS